MNQPPGDLFLRLAKYPRAFALLAVFVVALLAGQIRTPMLDGTMIDRLSGASPAHVAERRIAAASGDVSSVAIIVAPREASIGIVFAALDALHHELTVLHPAIRLDSITSVREQLFLYGLTLEHPVTDLLDALHGSEQAAAFVDDDGGRFLIIVTAPVALEHEVLDLVTAYEWRGPFGARTILAAAQLERDIVSGLRKDLRRVIPAIVGLMLFALLLAFGHWRALLLPAFASAAATIIIFALFSIAGVSINLVTLLALPVVLIVGLANSCHFLAKSRKMIALLDDVDAAVAAALRRVGPPFLLSTLTTAIALASLGLNELAPIAHLGLLSASALVVLFVVVLLTAPLSLRVYLLGSGTTLRESRLYVALSRRLARSRWQIGAALLLITIASGAAIPFLSVKSDPRIFFPDNAPFSDALQEFEDTFYAFSPFRVLISAGEPGQDSLEVLQGAGALRAALAAREGVRHASLQPAADGGGAFVLTTLLSRADDLWAARDYVAAWRPPPRAPVDVIYSSKALVYFEIDQQATQSLLRSLTWSVLLIFGMIAVVFWSVRALLSALLANAVPLLLVCGAVWFVGDPLNLVTLFVFLVVLGVVVDDSVHILFRHAAGGRLSGSSIEFSVVLSTALLCLGLLLCQLSDFPTTRQFASYCALALVAAVISDLSLLPLALRWREKKQP